jgi:hypothetical protein
MLHAAHQAIRHLCVSTLSAEQSDQFLIIQVPDRLKVPLGQRALGMLGSVQHAVNARRSDDR